MTHSLRTCPPCSSLNTWLVSSMTTWSLAVSASLNNATCSPRHATSCLLVLRRGVRCGVRACTVDHVCNINMLLIDYQLLLSTVSNTQETKTEYYTSSKITLGICVVHVYMYVHKTSCKLPKTTKSLLGCIFFLTLAQWWPYLSLVWQHSVEIPSGRWSVLAESAHPV